MKKYSNKNLGEKLDKFTPNEKEFDHAMKKITFGRWQILIIAFNIIIIAIMPVHIIGAVLLNGPRDFRCLPKDSRVSRNDLPDVYFNGEVLEWVKEIRYNTSSDLYSKVNQYNVTDNFDTERNCIIKTPEQPSSKFFNNKCLVKCTEEIPNDFDSYDFDIQSNCDDPTCPIVAYDRSVFRATVGSEWSLICNKEYLRPLFQTFYMLGAMFGCLSGGSLADIFGRLFTIRLLTGISFIANIIIYFTTSYTVLLLTRIISGICLHGLVMTCFTLAMEQIPTKQRTMAGMLLGLPFTIFTIIFAGIGYRINHWRSLFIIAASPIVVAVPITMFLDESTNWLIQKKRYEEAKLIVEKAYRMNNIKFSWSLIPRDPETKPVASLPTLELLNLIPEKSKFRKSMDNLVQDMKMFAQMKSITLVIPIVWFLQNILYFGLILGASVLSSNNPFIYLVMIGMCEAVGVLAGAPLTKKFGRKPILFVGYFVAGTLNFILIFLPTKAPWVIWTVVMPSILGCGAAYQVNYMYSPELFPTLLRGRGFAITAFTGHIGSLLAPFITDFVGAYTPWLMFLIFGLCGIIASMLILLLPETNNLPLCETMDEVFKRQKGELYSVTKNEDSTGTRKANKINIFSIEEACNS